MTEKRKVHNVIVDRKAVWSHEDAHTLKEWKKILLSKGINFDTVKLMVE